MKLNESFFLRDVLEVAPDLVGKLLVRKLPDGTVLTLRIAETECYRGEEDTACHAHKGRTKRTEVLYRAGGVYYVYLCYGIHWLLNVVTGKPDQPQAVLIRAGVTQMGPGKLTKYLHIDKHFNELPVAGQEELWIEDDGRRYEIQADQRVGIGYADQADQDRLWRFKLGQPLTRVLGITGGVGAGKSQVLERLKSNWGAAVIQTDELARELMEPGAEGYRQLIRALGTEILDRDEKIDRSKMADKMFGDAGMVARVNQIIHPLVWEETSRRIAKAGRGQSPLTVVESALFKNKPAFVDELWYIYAAPETRISRLVQSRGYTREKCLKIMESQYSEQEFQRICDGRIDNDGRTEETLQQIDNRISALLSGN